MDARRVRLFLKRGGVLAYPTESCYGLGCDPRNATAVKCLLRLKRRGAAKGLILIAAHPRQLRPFLAALSPALARRMHAAWPGPHTWLAPASRDCPAWLRGGHDAVAVRVTAHGGAARLCELAGMALVSTSANLSGGKPAKTAAECRRLFGRRVLVMPGHIGVRRRPSTIQDLASGAFIRR
ncbi:MAG TPA: Sua5/YciO/YrdC/YwlC family protein [Methylophilaceae bacterium]|nr:Sua5/YciO/YrdC/YwlC family protein [Methylophilaceae bacterium]